MAQLKDPSIIALKALIEKRHMTYSDLREEIGTRGHVSLILSGERNLTRGHIQKLTAKFGIPPAVFFDRQAANLYAGRKIKVPVVNLLDPEVEPDTEKMDALLYDVALKATRKAGKAHQGLMDNLRAAVKKAVA